MDGPPATFPVSPFPWDPRREGARVPDTLGCSLRKPLPESHPQAAWRAPWSLEPGSADPGGWRAGRKSWRKAKPQPVSVRTWPQQGERGKPQQSLDGDGLADEASSRHRVVPGGLPAELADPLTPALASGAGTGHHLPSHTLH